MMTVRSVAPRQDLSDCQEVNCRGKCAAIGVLIAPLCFSSITRNANARANSFQKAPHVEKDCFSPQSLSFEMPYHQSSYPDVLAGRRIAEELAEMGSAPFVFGNNGALSDSK